MGFEEEFDGFSPVERNKITFTEELGAGGNNTLRAVKKSAVYWLCDVVDATRHEPG